MVPHKTIENQTTENKRLAELHGRSAEDAVANDWQSKGYNVLARRLKTGVGEIDLVVADDDMLVFIEVKARKTLAAAAYAVPPRSQIRLLRAADTALACHFEWHRPAMRFDVALVHQGGIEHIEDAIRYH